jgi:hypothetical protein
MADYTTTHSGFQKVMEWCLTGPPSEAKAYAEGTVTPSFYHVMNDARLDYDAYIADIAEWRSKVSDYKPVVQEFLRGGDMLAARMNRTIKVEGVTMKFESFMFAKIEVDGRLGWLVERAVWGKVVEEWECSVDR